jgi:CRP/FNR family transcriptional regulator, anaerobic regulatory protein
MLGERGGGIMGDLVALHSASHCLTCPVRNKGLCAPLPPDHVRFLEHVSTGTHRYPAGTDLFRQGELCPNYFTIMEGWAFSYVLLEQGNRQILDFALPGTFLGFQPDPELPMTHSTQCLTSVRACISPKRGVYQVLQTEARFALKLCETEACQKEQASNHLANVGQRDAFARVTHLIVELFHRAHDRLPEKAGEETPFPLRLGHISDALGITREHTSRTLRALREQGICDTRRRVLRILNPTALIELSGFDRDHPTHFPTISRPA